MNSNTERDIIFEQSRQRHMVTIGLLSALKDNLEPDIAFKIAVEGFTNYMIEYYSSVLDRTEAGTQERFNLFREHYENYANKSTYIQIIETTEEVLKVRYDRCPFNEVMSEHGLSDMSYAFCLSDPGFTAAVLPGVDFSRDNVISKGDQYCDHTWMFKLRGD